jgi:hypothetical protein
MPKTFGRAREIDRWMRIITQYRKLGVLPKAMQYRTPILAIRNVYRLGRVLVFQSILAAILARIPARTTKITL